MKRIWPFILLLCTLGAAHAQEVEVIPLTYRTAEQLIPTLQPLVEPGGVLSGMQSTLVIRASRRNIEQLRQVVATLDRMPRRLLISVRSDVSATGERRGASVAGTAGSSDARISANVYDSRSSRDERITSQVQALEGSPAYIAAGQAVPVQGWNVTQTLDGAIVQDTTSYQTFSSGFYVTPRVAGERVFLDIAVQSATPGRHGPGSVNAQGIANTVSGRLGEWIQLGGIERSAARSGSGIVYGTSVARGATSSVWVKVDEIR